MAGTELEQWVTYDRPVEAMVEDIIRFFCSRDDTAPALMAFDPVISRFYHVNGTEDRDNKHPTLSNTVKYTLRGGHDPVIQQFLQDHDMTLTDLAKTAMVWDLDFHEEGMPFRDRLRVQHRQLTKLVSLYPRTASGKELNLLGFDLDVLMRDYFHLMHHLVVLNLEDLEDAE